MIAHQKTLRAPFCASGIGLHTGERAHVKVVPAPPDTGIQFHVGGRLIPARTEFVVSTRRCTCLGLDNARVDTVEHLLSALWGLGIDNAVVEMDGPELPALDGSALPWAESVLRAGLMDSAKPRQLLEVQETLGMRDGESWYVAVPGEELTLTCVTHFDHPLLGTEALTFHPEPQRYLEEIAPARTFGFISEVEALISAGLARGGSLDNALIIHEDRFSGELRLPQECLRHKMVDLVGDLALAGRRLRASITAVRPSHRGNAAFAALLADSENEHARH